MPSVTDVMIDMKHYLGGPHHHTRIVQGVVIYYECTIAISVFVTPDCFYNY